MSERVINKRAIVLINQETGERKDFGSINAAARFLGATFCNIQTQAVYNGVCKGWKVYESPDSIRKHIEDYEAQLKVLEQ